ncbi:hypothetical protein RRV45_16385 [Bacillus sp. DTU_2020_1000418_1_SI_GHA_SEK_038]|uniref:hypothetical protein n=1 Tax=Bacillus sp. DTU_2020_1000418_1_SI_GHA_SEK_038 TaxID=3077585 RepID=UPI0028E35B11|nr:hypothetical protein [Bacillus sp. DTU_2020_1000418_1_SI_GHA_SEK_038]WNS74473.1 hypothetical protein RRV45_16385 [Bacillus sp. DTU_2020_1000418_1_SI_GHA_SEK_038]
MIVENEKGYTLVAVLLTVTIFMLLAFSFMGQAANSMKQNKAVETKSQSVALAEMGVTYFQHAIQNIFKSNYQSIVQQVKSIRESDKIKRTNDEYTQIAMNLMKDIIKNELNPTAISIDDNPGANFSIQYNKNSNLKQDGKVLKIDFKSIGTENGKITTIETVMNIDFSELMSDSGTGETGNTGVQNAILPSGNDIPDPGNLSACDNDNKKVDYSNIKCQVNGSDSYDNNDQLIFNNSIFKVTGALSLPQMNKDIINSTLYVLGSMTTGNMNSLTHLKLHVNGAGHFGHFNGSGLTDSIIEIGGNAKFDNMKLLRSTIYVGEYKANFGQINGMENSVIFVNSDTDIKGLDIGSNSTVCVNGFLKIENNFNSNSNSKVYAKNSNNNNVIKGDAAFKDGGACSRKSGSLISWGDLSIYADYDYKY